MNALGLSPSQLPVLRWLRLAAWCLLPALLCLPLIAMQFTDEVNWTLSDFVFAGLLLGGSGVLLDWALRRAPNLAYFFASLLAVGGGLLQVWVNAAVGIVGSEGNPQNLLFFAVVGLALVGALLSGGRAECLVWAMRVTALAQLAVAIVLGAVDVLLPFTAIYLAIWLGAAALFRYSARVARS